MSIVYGRLLVKALFPPFSTTADETLLVSFDARFSDVPVLALAFDLGRDNITIMVPLDAYAEDSSVMHHHELNVTAPASTISVTARLSSSGNADGSSCNSVSLSSFSFSLSHFAFLRVLRRKLGCIHGLMRCQGCMFRQPVSKWWHVCVCRPQAGVCVQRRLRWQPL